MAKNNEMNESMMILVSFLCLLSLPAVLGLQKSSKIQRFSYEINQKYNSNENGGSRNYMNEIRNKIRNVIVIGTSLASNVLQPKSLITPKSAAIAAIVSTSLPSNAQAGLLKPFNKNLQPYQKLASTPLFFVCNSGGNPYLQEDLQAGKSDQRIVVYFMSSEDANEYLNEIAQGSPGNVNEFRIMTTSMEKIMNKIKSRKQSRKLGRYAISNIFRIQPSSRQCENAESLLGGIGTPAAKNKLQGVSIPMFSAKGLLLQKKNGELITPFYFAYEDLLDDWSRITSASSESKPSNPDVKVTDFTDVMCLSQGISSESITTSVKTPKGGKEDGKIQKMKLIQTNPAIIPPKREIELLRSYYRNTHAGLKNEYQDARIIGAPRER